MKNGIDRCISLKAKNEVDTFCIILSVLFDTEKLVVNCTIMRLKENEALAYLTANGHEVSRITYYRIKARVEQKKLQRLYEIAKVGFVHQHIERIDQLELVQREMWKNYYLEKSPLKKVVILEKIAAVQPFLSAYYEATKMVMKETGFVNSSKNHETEGVLCSRDSFENSR